MKKYIVLYFFSFFSFCLFIYLLNHDCYVKKFYLNLTIPINIRGNICEPSGYGLRVEPLYPISFLFISFFIFLSVYLRKKNDKL